MAKLQADVIMEVLYFILHYDSITLEKITSNFAIDKEAALEFIEIFENEGVLEESDKNKNEWDVCVYEYDDLSDTLQDLLDKKYDEVKITKVLAGEESETREISNILSDKRYGWYPNEGDIDDGVIAWIRIVDKNAPFHISREMIAYRESVILAKYKDGKWNLLPPFEKYNRNPLLSDPRTIRDEVKISHYSIASDDDVKNHTQHYKLSKDYKKLILQIDEEHEEEVYDALLIAAGCIDRTAMEVQPDQLKPIANAYLIIHDLISLINNTQEESSDAMDS